jgi:hypothetical protein
MEGCRAPQGSPIVASKEFEEYRLEVYQGTDGLMYSRLHPKPGPDGHNFRKMFGRMQKLAREAGYPAIDRYDIVYE